MELLLTGGTGEIGRPTLAALLESGHSVRATSRGQANDRQIANAGATPLRTDLLDPASVRKSVAGAAAILHLATRIPSPATMADLSAWAENDRLREETTRSLVDAALAHGVETLVVQTYFAVSRPRGERWIDDDPGELLESDDWSRIQVMASARAAENEVGRFVRAGGRGVVLRFGSIYSESSDQLHAQVESLRGGVATIPGTGRNYWPYLTSEDAGRACAAALGAAPGIYHVADEEPVTIRDFYTIAASALGVATPEVAEAEGPFAPILLGSWRLSNRRFREASGWSPRVGSVRDGWPAAAARYLAGGIGRRPG